MVFEKYTPSINLRNTLTEAGLSNVDQTLLVSVISIYVAAFLTVAISMFAALGMQRGH